MVHWNSWYIDYRNIHLGLAAMVKHPVPINWNWNIPIKLRQTQRSYQVGWIYFNFYLQKCILYIYICIYSHHFPINMHWKLIQASKLLYRLLLIYPIIAHHIHIPYLMVSYIISHPFISPNSDWFVAEITMFHWTITQRHNRRHDEAVCLACPSRPSMAMGNFREASHAQTYGGFLNWYPAGWFSLKSYSNGWVWDLLLTMVINKCYYRTMVFINVLLMWVFIIVF